MCGLCQTSSNIRICTCILFNYEMGHDNEKETKFKHQDQNMEFPMSHISQYEVTN